MSLIPNTKIVALLLLTTILLCRANAESSFESLNERLSSLEYKLNGQTSSGDEAASQETVEVWIAKVKELQGRIEVLEHRLSLLERSPSSAKNLEQKTVEPHSLKEEESMDDILERFLEEDSGDTDVLREQATHRAEMAPDTPTLGADSSTAQYNQALALFNKGAYREAKQAFAYYLEQYPAGKFVKQAKEKMALCDGPKKPMSKEPSLKATVSSAQERVRLYAQKYKKNSKGEAGADALYKLAEALSETGNKAKTCLVAKKVVDDFPKNKEAEKAKALLKKHNCPSKKTSTD